MFVRHVIQWSNVFQMRKKDQWILSVKEYEKFIDMISESTFQPLRNYYLMTFDLVSLMKNIQSYLWHVKLCAIVRKTKGDLVRGKKCFFATNSLYTQCSCGGSQVYLLYRFSIPALRSFWEINGVGAIMGIIWRVLKGKHLSLLTTTRKTPQGPPKICSNTQLPSL